MARNNYKISPSDLWDIFAEACEFDYDDDQRELHQPGDYASLKKGYASVISYWMSEDTIGGSKLHKCGYDQLLPSDIAESVDAYMQDCERVKKQLAKKHFG
jgi:hypothetical protein